MTSQESLLAHSHCSRHPDDLLGYHTDSSLDGFIVADDGASQDADDSDEDDFDEDGSGKDDSSGDDAGEDDLAEDEDFYSDDFPACTPASEDESDETDASDAIEFLETLSVGDSAEEDLASLEESDHTDTAEEDEPMQLSDICLEAKYAELRQRLLKLETASALAQLYPPHISGACVLRPPCMDETTMLAEETDSDSYDQELQADGNFHEVVLDDFCVFRAPDHPKGLQGQYEWLHTVAQNPEDGNWLLDGVLAGRDGLKRITGYITRVSIGNFEDLSSVTTAHTIWVQTEKSSLVGCWYRLNQPSGGYRMIWNEFLWLADFTKHFIDYLHESTRIGKLVKLLDFESDFWARLQQWHGTIKEHREILQQWHLQRTKDTKRPLDMRRDVLWYSQFLRHQAYSLCGDLDDDKFQHPVWNEAAAGSYSYDQQSESKHEKTVVTMNVAASFHEKFPQWQDQYDLLRIVEVCPEVEAFRVQRRQQWSFPNKFEVPQGEFFLTQSIAGHGAGHSKISLAQHLLEAASGRNQPIGPVSPNYVTDKIVIVRIHDEATQSYSFYYAWVRNVLSRTAVEVIWLFLPSETLCGTGAYPIGNELFFSTECNCDPVPVHDIIQVITASVFSDRATNGASLFVHGTYDEQNQAHVSADIRQLVCKCKYKLGKEKKNPTPTQKGGLPKLKTVSLFCGAGLFDHAMASTGYVEPVYAIEHWEVAAATCKANDNLNRTKVVTGSVNPCLTKIMTGKVPVEPTDCVIAGCPCQGYSLLNSFKHSKKSQQNCSLLANTLSWFEVLLPAYGIIENVPNMDSLDPNPCAQAICHFVALGYQVRKSFPRVSELGGASSRERLILMVAAPNAILPEALKESHGMQSDQARLRTCEEAISNLSHLSNDTVLNISDPDHIPLYRFKVDLNKTVNFRNVVERIPVKALGCGIAQTYRLGHLSSSQRKWFRTLSSLKKAENSKCLRRINREKPFKTVCCLISPFDGRHSGEILHYSQHRTISIKEARRAMDVPDWFLMAGNIRDQYKQLGNGVPWTLGAALGRTIGKAWIATLTRQPSLVKPDEETVPTHNSRPVPDPMMRLSAKKPPVYASKAVGTNITQAAKGSAEIMVPAKKRRPRQVVSSDDDDSDVEFLGERPILKLSRD